VSLPQDKYLEHILHKTKYAAIKREMPKRKTHNTSLV